MAAGPYFPMMVAGFVGKGSCLPTFHSRRGYGDPVDTATLDRLISSDFIKTRPAKQLTCSGDMFDVGKSKIIGDIVIFNKGSAGHSQPFYLLKFCDEIRKIAWVEGDIGIEIADDIIGNGLDTLIAGLKCKYLCGELAVSVFWSPDKFHPRMAAKVAPDDIVGAVRRAVADDDPFSRQKGLRRHRLDSLFNEACFVVGRCYNSIFHRFH
jgi:hypothetical protein